MTGNRYKAVILNSAGQIVLAALGQCALGILYSEVSVIGQGVEVAIGASILKGFIGAAGCTKGDFLKVDAAGKLSTAAATSVSGATTVGSNTVGQALETATTGQIASVLWNPVGQVPTTLA